LLIIFLYYPFSLYICSCEIVRDKKTNESLCYAFIEFDTKEQAEAAYFKMDNVLVDDRRIHVDFSQSVSKLHSEFIGKNFFFLTNLSYASVLFFFFFFFFAFF